MLDNLDFKKIIEPVMPRQPLMRMITVDDDGNMVYTYFVGGQTDPLQLESTRFESCPSRTG